MPLSLIYYHNLSLIDYDYHLIWLALLLILKKNENYIIQTKYFSDSFMKIEVGEISHDYTIVLSNRSNAYQELHYYLLTNRILHNIAVPGRWLRWYLFEHRKILLLTFAKWKSKNYMFYSFLLLNLIFLFNCKLRNQLIPQSHIVLSIYYSISIIILS